MKHVPEIAIDLLRKRLVPNGYSQSLFFIICSHVFVYFRFDVKICDSIQATRTEILKDIPGKFAIFCNPSNKIDEELIKTAG